MNTASNSSATAATLFQDRPLDDTYELPAPYSLTAPPEGEGWEVALRSLLVLCLVASMMVFGFSVAGPSQPTASGASTSPAAAVKALDHATPIAFPVPAQQKTAAHATTIL